MNRSLGLYHIDARSIHQITSGMFDDNSPVFDPTGRNLYFLSTRNFSAPRMSSTTRNFIYPNENTLLAMPLRKNIPSPLSPATQENNIHELSGKLIIDLAGIEARSVRLPVDEIGRASCRER